jgi:hypothetical protein
MAKNKTEFDAELATFVTTQAQILTLINQLITEQTNAFNRFLAKIAAGNDYQAEFDQVATLSQNATNAIPTIQSAIAQAQSEGQ